MPLWHCGVGISKKKGLTGNEGTEVGPQQNNEIRRKNDEGESRRERGREKEKQRNNYAILRLHGKCPVIA